jgi:rhamnogalacturonyl hydrolase YesR
MNRELVEAVASKALDYPYRMWGFGEGMALLGIIRAARVLDRPQWIDAVWELIEPTLKTEPGPLDHLIPLEVLVEFDIDLTHRFASAAGMGPHRPDLKGLETMVWVDCMHTDIPGFMLAGRPDAAAQAIRLACLRFQDESGLFSHGYDGKPNRVHWGRGQGWALHGLIAGGSPQAGVVLHALEKHEEDGRWRTVVDDSSAPLENSVSALVAAAVFELGDSSWYPMGKRALRAAIAQLDADGGLPVSEATPVGSYVDRGTGIYPWGQGPLLLALLKEQP